LRRLEPLDSATSSRPTPKVASPAKPPKGLSIRSTAAGAALYAARGFEAGEPVLVFERVIWRAAPDVSTVEHPSGDNFVDPVLALANRTPDPNCRIAPELMALIARRDIVRGERISVAPKNGAAVTARRGERAHGG
jgi:hypothetical protein